MTALESCIDRSANRTPISGFETRRITKAKKPIRVSVTAAMAASRAGPSFVTTSRTDFTTRPTHPTQRGGWPAPLGKICPGRG